MYLLSYAILFAFSCYWVAQTVNRLPRDFMEFKEHIQEKKWGEFGADFAVFLFFWMVGVFLFFAVVWPTGRMIAKGLYGFIELLFGFQV